MSRAVTYALLALVIVLSAGLIWEWYFPKVEYVQVQTPVVMHETPRVGKLPKIVLERPVEVVAITTRVAEKINEKYNVEVGPAEEDDKLLTEVVVPMAPEGGSVAVVLEPDGHIETVFVPKKTPFFRLGGPFEIGGGILATQDGLGGTVFISKELFRTGKAHWRLTGRVDATQLDTDFAVSAVVVWRF
jgi:hypothetical protein